jgi:mRNA interferase MazF
MTPYKRGDVVLVAFPFIDLTTFKTRPALVISCESLNHKYNDIIAIAITSQIPKILSEDEFLLSLEDQQKAGLPKRSIVKIGKIVTLDQRLVRKRLGNLSASTLQKLTTSAL